MTIDTTNMRSHLQRKLFEEDGIYHPLWIAMQDDAEVTAVVRSRQLHKRGRNNRNMIRDFIALDFETANQQPSSVCSIGVVMVRNGLVADSFYSLIQPEPNYYNYWCQQVHGLSQCDTDDAPVFSKVWEQLEEKIADVFFSDQQPIDDLRYQIASIPFVAHNARFDEGCLKAVFRVYQMDYPDYRFYDTLAAARRQFGHSLPNHQLHTVAAELRREKRK